ncbi:cupin domain-containing protein [Halobaculum marinum]|uniref:Cupin domain-containing protein n=1 Tax=Halobaculum marinum TaxID=3031996 RepID=A0ABD5X1I3_9EURY|nr:cupin domain-containing protein [Halobaculum sp. DT55]
MSGDGTPDRDDHTTTTADAAAYRRLSVDGWGESPDPDRVRRTLDEALGTTPYEFDLRETKPGEPVRPPTDPYPGAQELLFVLAGELTVETAEGELRFGPNEGVLVPPDATDRPVATGGDPCRFLALGAP